MIRLTPSPEPWTEEEEKELIAKHGDGLDASMQPFNQYCLRLQEEGHFVDLLWCLEKVNQWLYLIGNFTGLRDMLIKSVEQRQGKLH
jgi:hypothetical protein